MLKGSVLINKQFLEDLHVQYIKDTKFLEEHGWKKKISNDSTNVWISPKGEEHKHHYGLVVRENERLAIEVARHDVVMESFEQFAVQIFYEDHDEPHDFLFPCIKDGKIYHYLEAEVSAIYNKEFKYKMNSWVKLLKLLETLDIKPKQGDIIKVNDLNDASCKFELRK
jgi:hypothetical protein